MTGKISGIITYLIYVITICFHFSLSSCYSQSKTKYNLSLEESDSSGIAKGWQVFPIKKGQDYILKSDTNIRYDGLRSINISSLNANNSFGSIHRTLPVPSNGNSIKLVGFIKTSKIENGYAGLWIRIEDNKGNILYFNNMSDRGIKGTNDWKEYSITAPFEHLVTYKIVIGALLVGSGQVWVDNFKVFINSTPIDKVEVGNSLVNKEGSINSILVKSDSDLNKIQIKISNNQINNLANFCKVWGFLKYYHPNVKNGYKDWDSALLSNIPKVYSKTNNDLYNIIESLLDTQNINAQKIHINIDKKNRIPNYFSIYNFLINSKVNKNLVNKFNDFYYSSQFDNNQTYVDVNTKNGNPVFKNEYRYSNNSTFPSPSLRLLALFRYWNIIEYFNPNKYLLQKKWDKVLIEFIPRFLEAKNKEEYLLENLALFSQIHDSHSFVLSPIIDSLKGIYITPFKARFIKDKLIISGFYTNSPDVVEKFKLGDRVLEIDGIPINKLTKKFLPYTPGSNISSLSRDLASSSGFLLRSNLKSSNITIENENGIKKIPINRIPVAIANRSIDQSDIIKKPSFIILKENIGYINAGKIFDKSIDSIRVLFKDCIGLIIDLRCYPSTFMPYVYGDWLKSTSSQFAYFTKSDIKFPGQFFKTKPVYNGNTSNTIQNTIDKANKLFNGKLVLIVNELTQSQSEFTAMALSTVANSITIGNTTAGADGDISEIWLPGSIRTYFSGIGVYYPNSNKTQGTGVKIDIKLTPTIKGIKEERDEYLEKAIQLLKK